MNLLIQKLDTLDHHTEHKFVDVYDHIKSIVGKLAHKEEDSEERIALLETLVQKVIQIQYILLTVFMYCIC